MAIRAKPAQTARAAKPVTAPEVIQRDAVAAHEGGTARAAAARRFKSAPRKPTLPTAAVAASRGISNSDAQKIAKALARRNNKAYAIVMACDIRASTTFMLHVESFEEYAKDIANFVTYLRCAVNERGGWFDKFTGDGALVFWLNPNPRFDFFVDQVLSLAVEAQVTFLKTTVSGLRQYAGCIPERFGLSVGIDIGNCILSDLKPTSDFTYKGKKPPLTATNNGVTVLGRAVVGAVRMVQVAEPHQVLLNEGPGEFAAREESKRLLVARDLEVAKHLVENKDLKGRQLAYAIKSKRVDDAVAEHLGLNSRANSRADDEVK